MRAREELEKAFTVLKHIKKKAGSGFFDAEYHLLVEEVQLMQRETTNKNKVTLTQITCPPKQSGIKPVLIKS